MRLFVLGFLTATLFSSCDFFHNKKIHGDGNVTTQTRAVSNFEVVDVSGAVDVYVKQDSAFSVKVVVDANLQEYVEVYEDNGVLKIHQQDNTSLDATKGIKVYVSAPKFEEFEASGACDIISENKIGSDGTIAVDVSGASTVNLEIKAPKINVGASGACNITLRGETKNVTIDGSGSTDVKAFELLSENVVVGLSGAGDAQVFASTKLEANISGAASVRYRGNATVSSNISGAGSVKKAD